MNKACKIKYEFPLFSENQLFVFDDFIHNINYTKYISRLLGQSFTAVSKAVKLKFSNLKNFNTWLQQFRPGNKYIVVVKKKTY